MLNRRSISAGNARGSAPIPTVLLLATLAFGCNGLTPTELACTENAACPPSYCCSLTTSFCAPEGDPTCSFTLDAGTTDAGVDAGPEIDAGLDAGFTGDAGLHDAGEDAGVDAGHLDAGEDAGIDAGPLDAGLRADAGTDAGPPDAGTFDDAGSDAGPIAGDAGQGTDAGADAGRDAGTTIAPPSNLTYATNPAIFTKGMQITNDDPSSSGGAVASYAISPSTLPTGLSFSTSTGILSGTPEALTAETPYSVTATNPGGSTHVTLNITVNDVPPSDLSYPVNPAVFTAGQAIASDTPTHTGGAVTLYAISPTLPPGLSFSTSSGTVSGTPTTVSAATGYMVTASNSGGSTQVQLDVSVMAATAPSNLTYSMNPVVYLKSVTITNNVPSSSGGAVASYAISPALPTGLSFNTVTGVVSGTPATLLTQTPFTVTATNTGGSTQATLTITVNDVPPRGLAYEVDPATYHEGLQITPNAPSYSGGTVTMFTISPDLPGGLSIDMVSGIISGTPTVTSTATDYTVTATNSGGSAQADLNITVTNEPTDLSYSQNPAVYTLGQTITNNTPSNTGGAVMAYDISPSLPAGLSFDTATGVISGAPTALSAATDYTVNASNATGSASVDLTISVVDISPSGLSYSTNPAIYTLGQTITNNTPSNMGGAVMTYDIFPPLPVGLSFSAATGVISGVPTALSAATVYTVGASNVNGSTSVNLTISVVDVPPTGLSYSTNPAVYTLGQGITSNAPSTTGGGQVVSYAISPALPTGLSLNTSSGIISGTPSVLSQAATYTVTATNTGGSTTASLSIAVNAVPPSSLAYATNPAVYTKGVAIPNNTPLNSGGTITSYGISPALPSGLSFNTVTGVISGTPTALSTTQGYLVTGTNSGGSTTVTLTLTVNDAAPTNLTYSANPAVYTKGQTITNDIPSSAGGTVVSYSISPAPPAGLSFSTTTGVLSGMPTTVTAKANYTVTATNTGGSTTVVLPITVNDVAPSSLTYATNPLVATKGTAITSDVPSISGGPVVSWGVSPTLPSGLSFNTSSGVVSGSATAVAAKANYTVTATNSGGSTTVALSITVNDVAPSGLSYEPNPAFFTVGTTITNLTPALSGGGSVTSWSISPALPSGLSFSTTTGAISGTPTAAAASTGYVVTATNSGGSTQATLTITVTAPQITIGLSGVLAVNGSACAVVAGGVQCWGANYDGQLGNNSTATSAVPVAVSGLTGGAQAVAVGENHACALVNGGVQCWGYNAYGQLGNNSAANTAVPVQVSGLSSGVQAIAATSYSSCAVRNGGAQCWGDNANGQLGNNSTTNSPVPVQVDGLSSGVQTVAGGARHSCALVNGGARCWGDNTLGELGNGSTTDVSVIPVSVSGLTAGVQALSAGQDCTCAVVNGGAQCWGDGTFGALGNGSTENAIVPVHVQGLSSGVQAVSAGDNISCAIVNGGAQCWGYGVNGALGNGSTTPTTTPVQVAGLTSGVQAIAAGASAVCALVNGGLQCWGSETSGSLGNGVTTGQSDVPVQVTGITGGLQAIATGDGFQCAIVNGGVQCWGSNYLGVLGNNSTTDSSVPVHVQGLSSGVQAISANEINACAIVNGGAWVWGDNEEGQFGNGTTTASLVPVEVPTLTSGVQAIAAGDADICVITNGSAWCWGYSVNGQAGNGTEISNVPRQVTGLTSGVQSIVAGDTATCAVVNGGAWCWGGNFSGELGNDSTAEPAGPVQVYGLGSNVQAITTGHSNSNGAQSCALVNGGVQCWGYNQLGQVGNGTTVNTDAPVTVSGLSGVEAIGTSDFTSCALEGGSVQCWGDLYGETPSQVATLSSGVQAISLGGDEHACAIVNTLVECWSNGQTPAVVPPWAQ